MPQHRVVVAVSLDREIAEILKKYRARGLNISRIVELAIKHYITHNPALLDLVDKDKLALILS